MNRLIYFPLEPYKSRYTEYTSTEGGVYETQFKKAGVEFISLRPHGMLQDITHGAVVDYVERSKWSFTQMIGLLGMIAKGKVSSEDAIFFDDFWTPGFEMVPYALHLAGIHAPMFSFCYAQSTDPFDFTASMAHWMRPMELGWANAQKAVMCASSQMFNQWGSGGLPISKLRWVGLPFSSEVLKSKFGVTNTKEIRRSKTNTVVFSSRWDKEKNPRFFLKLVQAFKDVEFIVCSGLPELTSNDPSLLEALDSVRCGCSNLKVMTGLSKLEYYNILRRAKVQFNCSFQDFVSFTLLDAVASGCAPLYPNRLTFPHALNNSKSNLYGDPGEDQFDGRTLKDVCHKLVNLLQDHVEDYFWVTKKYEHSVQRMLHYIGFSVESPDSLEYLCTMEVSEIKEHYAKVVSR